VFFFATKWLNKHVDSECGRYGSGMLRRKLHDNTTEIRLVVQNDDDSEDEAQRIEEEDLDKVLVLFADGVGSDGWALEARQDATNGAPLSCCGLDWVLPVDSSVVAVGSQD